MIPTAQAAWLPEPLVEFFEDGQGQVESAYITLRHAPYARAVQPNPAHLVFLYVGGDDLPVGIRLLEPIAGTFGTEIVVRLLQSPDGAPVGVDREVTHRFQPMTLDQLDRVIHTVQRASQRLPEVCP